MPTEQTDPPSQDYRGQELAAGDAVAYVSQGGLMPGLLFTGQIALIHKNEMCIKSDSLMSSLITLRGEEREAFGGRPARIRYATVHRIADQPEH
ncbi:hypothetical protein AB0P17_15410 [Streptomyces sp. NPDC088124]|uniref:hypothetical protein n=1 Tax=Streptomyces sp. NPDC088124 TaxID=3154654 RepID=UPI00342E4995